MLHIGIIGLGFMGSTHLRAWQYAREVAGLSCRVIAVADAKPDRRAGRLRPLTDNINRVGDDDSEVPLAFDPAEVKGYDNPLDLIADERINAVSLCTPTDTHVELCLAAMRAGKHVLLEKPVALRSSEAKKLVDEQAKHPGVVVVPAMCMRFWPAWSWLKARVDAGTFGAVRTATFQRLGVRPKWSSFYASPEKTGGALFDLHVHDADFLRWCFGNPTRVSSVAHVGADESIHHITTQYTGTKCPHLVAEGGWDHQEAFGFRMRYVVNFDDATADFDLSRERPLLLSRSGQLEVIELDPLQGYEHEVIHFARCALAKRRSDVVTLDDGLAVTKLLEAEEESARTGEPVAV
jgi:predicted dehydrogenase